MDGPHGLGVTAEDFGLKGPRGWAFRGVRLEAEPGSLIAIEGPSGSGRTCLLLALTGRMKATEGTAAVGAAGLPKQMAAVRRTSALAHVPGVTDLDPALTVGEHLRERALLQRRFGGSLRALLRPRGERVSEAKSRIGAALAAAGLDPETLPKGARTAVRDLERLEALRLSVALALIGRPRLLGVDDADLKLSDAERSDVWALLASLAESGTTVVAVCSEAPEGAVVVSTAPSDASGTAGEQGPGASRETAATPGTETTADTTTAAAAATTKADTGTTKADAGTTKSDADGGTDATATSPTAETAKATDADAKATTDADADADSDSDSDSDSGTNDKETADALTETGRS
ncbi:ATP-binding cassette domain-containing protein [Streptomyces sp. NBC_00638]|uniref:ATP-binding cassette domain-containing protein n=1 Tax=Streptomyces sp. NBC_00638 TaxID=2975794 RepID=UPI002253E0A6|nr:ATP-binding cassette domain-containing protein [Streptomyces sp. NBC_00638]MCX5003247.1 ATP-binding cassette domain-containing protein [Streptomyces sp. NBC_00638]